MKALSVQLEVVDEGLHGLLHCRAAAAQRAEEKEVSLSCEEGRWLAPLTRLAEHDWSIMKATKRMGSLCLIKRASDGTNLQTRYTADKAERA
jgi:hypothetical protein